MTLQELEQVKESVFNGIVSKISIDDSFFYAEMFIEKIPEIFQEKFKVTVLMNLFNSKDFKNEYNISTNKFNKAKKIRSTFEVDSIEFIKSKEDTMIVVYEQLSKQIAADLFQENGANINMVMSSPHNRKQYV